ncbi:trypsin-like peptidase domain-containing protein [Gaetbulibacter saemankumensis]|uniref:trypsin-like peptidase domain-containing protein n=1 Tax=Gaetbulibacter saemankumensis TaxID=311208 RepID=UPI0004108A06|nr:trypsin-like peptidase domain-containing protein [Gaetbulibacter saemankumensis]
MKKILSLVLVSALGGVIALSTYKLFLEPENKVVTTSAINNPAFLPATNVATLPNLEDAPNFTIAAENAVNAVVHVKNVTINKGQMTFEDLFFGRSTPRAQMGTGSGVIVNADGYIITNNHVINDSDELSVTLNNNKTYKAEIVGSDPKTDIALLKIEADEDLPFITFADSDQTKIGEWVLAVGNPFNLTSTVTAGIISAKSRNLDPTGKYSQSFIQTDAAVNPGNSGGALVNTNGELIGINTAISSQTGSYIGYSFAVPSNIARRVIEDIMEYGNVQNGILGIQGAPLNSDIAEELGINDTEGIYIDSVVEDSGADKAGLEKGDIIKEIDNIKISKFADLTGHISARRAGDVVTIKVSKNGKLKTLPVTLTRNETYTMPLVGRVKNAKKEDLKAVNATNGVKIIDLNGEYASYWKNNGIEEGAIITAINGTKIHSVDDVQEAIKSRAQYEALRLEIISTNGEKERFNFR